MRDLFFLHGGAPAYAIGFALTVALAAWLTPRRWWRRPTLRGGAVLAAGTLAIGALLLVLGGRPQAALAQAGPLTAPAPPPLAAPAPLAGARYRVAEELNLRAARGVHAARLAVLPAGSWVVATGALDGDWWQVRTHADGHALTGWTSSLWLRRGDEADARMLGKPRNPTP